VSGAFFPFLLAIINPLIRAEGRGYAFPNTIYLYISHTIYNPHTYILIIIIIINNTIPYTLITP
jgi:hypothetical protein